MPTIEEGGLRFDFAGAAAVEHFDDPGSHGLSHTMKAVDFVVTWSDELWLVEVKDPADPHIPVDRARERQQAFLRDVENDTLINGALKPKLRDSFLYLHLSGRLDQLVVRYLVLLAIDLDPRLLMRQRERLKHLLPVRGPWGRPWMRPFVTDALVLDFDGWNSVLPDCRVERL